MFPKGIVPWPRYALAGSRLSVPALAQHLLDHVGHVERLAAPGLDGGGGDDITKADVDLYGNAHLAEERRQANADAGILPGIAMGSAWSLSASNSRALSSTACRQTSWNVLARAAVS